jgi:hypothetical protein
MPFFRSALCALLIVLTVGCVSSEKLDDTSGTPSRPQAQTEVHFDFIEHDNFPSAGSLYNVNNTFVGSCVLVTPNIALTAGHCIAMGDLKYARFGDEEIGIDVQCTHKDYKSGDDIGILILKSKSSHKPISMLSDVDIVPDMYPLHTIAHGEGKKKLSKDNVYHYYGILKNKPNEIIFLPLKTSVWFGDSGGALVYEDNNGDYILIGIITHFSSIDEQVYECVARRTDNFNLYDDIWQPWITK